MATFTIQQFAGASLVTGGGLQELSVAERAEDCILRGGVIRALKKPQSTDTTLVDNARTIYRHRQPDGSQMWFSWGDVVNVVASPVPNDRYNRLYWSMPDVDGSPQAPRYRSDDGSGTAPTIPLPAMAADTDGYELGIPAPFSAPSVDSARLAAAIPVPDEIPAAAKRFDVIRERRPIGVGGAPDFRGESFATQNPEVVAEGGFANGYPYFFSDDVLPDTSDRDYLVFLTGTYQLIRASDPTLADYPAQGYNGPVVRFQDKPLGKVSELRALGATNVLATLTESTNRPFDANIRLVDFGKILVRFPFNTSITRYADLGLWIGRDANFKPLVMFGAPQRDLTVRVSDLEQPVRFTLQLRFEVDPSSIGTINQAGDGTLDDIASGKFRNSTYVSTFVSRYGEEGPPSEPSVNVFGNLRDVTVPVTVDVRNAPPVVKNGGSVRLYRSNAGLQQAQYQFLDELLIPAPASTSVDYGDDTTNLELAEVLPSETWLPPPIGLKGLTRLDNGAIAGFIDRDVYFSVPYLPHAWPEANRVSVEHNVVALAETPLGLHVLTEGLPALLNGAPGAYAVTTSEFAESCVDARTVVRMADSILYFSPDGLARLSGIQGQVLTENILTPEDWQSRYLNKGLIGHYWEDRYVALPDGSVADAKGFMLEPGIMGFVELTPNVTTTAGYSDRNDGSLYLAVRENDEDKLTKWAADDELNAWVWQSRDRAASGPVSFLRSHAVLEHPMDGQWLEIWIPSGVGKEAAYRRVAFVVCVAGEAWELFPLPTHSCWYGDITSTEASAETRMRQLQFSFPIFQLPIRQLGAGTATLRPLSQFLVSGDGATYPAAGETWTWPASAGTDFWIYTSGNVYTYPSFEMLTDWRPASLDVDTLTARQQSDSLVALASVPTIPADVYVLRVAPPGTAADARGDLYIGGGITQRRGDPAGPKQGDLDFTINIAEPASGCYMHVTGEGIDREGRARMIGSDDNLDSAIARPWTGISGIGIAPELSNVIGVRMRGTFNLKAFVMSSDLQGIAALIG